MILNNIVRGGATVSSDHARSKAHEWVLEKAYRYYFHDCVVNLHVVT